MSPGQGKRARLVRSTRTWTAGGWGVMDTRGRGRAGRSPPAGQGLRGGVCWGGTKATPRGSEAAPRAGQCPRLCTVTPPWGHRAIQQGHVSLGWGRPGGTGRRTWKPRGSCRKGAPGGVVARKGCSPRAGAGECALAPGYLCTKLSWGKGQGDPGPGEPAFCKPQGESHGVRRDGQSHP